MTSHGYQKREACLTLSNRCLVVQLFGLEFIILQILRKASIEGSSVNQALTSGGNAIHLAHPAPEGREDILSHLPGV